MFCCFVGYKETYIDRARCFRCNKLGHRAKDCWFGWQATRNIQHSNSYLSEYSYDMYKSAQGPNSSPIQSKEMVQW